MRTQLKILLLLVDVLVVLAIYAISPMDWAIANNELRKVNFKIGTDTTSTTVTVQGDGVSVDAPASTASSDGSGQTASVADLSTTQAAQHPKVKDTGKQRFLFFGDSMLEGLSRRLCDYAAHNGHEQRTVLWYSSTSEKWATTNTLDYHHLLPVQQRTFRARPRPSRQIHRHHRQEDGRHTFCLDQPAQLER